jgi:putative ABC transport system permease protein
LVLAYLGVRAVVTVGPYLRGIENVHVDYRVMLLAMSLGVLTGVASGIAPALGSARGPVNLAAGADGWCGGRIQHRVVGLMFALTTVLLVAGGLLTRSFSNLVQLDTGFEARNVATIRLPEIPERYEEVEPRNAFLARVLAGIEAIPGVITAGGADNLPFPGVRAGHWISPVGGDDSLLTPVRRVLPGYFETMAIPLVAGRSFDLSDVAGNTRTVMVSESAARLLWPGASGVGATLNHHPYHVDLTVVGVVGDVLEGWAGTEPRPMIYLPLPQVSQGELSLVARTAGDPAAIIPLLREAVWAVDPDVVVTMQTTVESLVANSTLSERYRTLLVMFFGISAILLAAMDLFGVTSRSVTARTKELGIRVALGAPGSSLVRTVLRRSLVTVLAGTAVGLVGAFWVSRLLTGFLFGVEPTDPTTYAIVVAVLVATCILAGYLPTRRLATVDPMLVLRSE